MTEHPFHDQQFASSYLGWDKFWTRLNCRPDLKNQRVLDLGCGHGAFSIRAAECGAEVVGVDPDSRRREYAQANLYRNFAHLKQRVRFARQIEECRERFSVVLTQETLEHITDLESTLRSLHGLLEPEALVYAGWGPIWTSPFGGHALMKEIRGIEVPFSHFWVRSALKRYDKQYPTRRSFSIQDVGMNGLGVKDYKRIINESPFEIVSWRTNVGAHPAYRILKICSKLSETYFTQNVYAILKA